jgi:hypothetical protein
MPAICSPLARATSDIRSVVSLFDSEIFLRIVHTEEPYFVDRCCVVTYLPEVFDLPYGGCNCNGNYKRKDMGEFGFYTEVFKFHNVPSHPVRYI